MTVFTDAQLEEMLDQTESDRVERKQSFGGDAKNAVREAVCAFANDLPDHGKAGVVFIGANDDGSPSHLTITDELLRSLADIKTDGNILPPPTMTVSKRHLRGAEMAVITVEPADSPPVKFKGRIWVRIGPRRGIATEQDERILNEKRRHRDRTFDLRPIASAIQRDLSRSLFEDVYLPSAFSPDVLEANNRTYEQRLAATKMLVSVEDAIPTVLGILVLGTSVRDYLPGAYIQFLRIDGGELSDDITDEEEIDGHLVDILRRIDDKLKAHNHTRVDIISGPVESRRQPYPLPALQQVVRNAVMHRTYEATNTPVRVYWYDDRIEIISPGGPFGAVMESNFGTPGVTDYRNPNLAEAMRVLGFVQRFGVGIALAQRELTKNGNPPLEFDIQPTVIGVTIRRAA